MRSSSDMEKIIAESMVELSLLNIKKQGELISEYKARKKKIDSLKREIKWYKTIKMYLDTNPKEEFVTKEHDRVTKRIDLIHDAFPDYKRQKFEKMSVKAERKLKKKYLEELGVPALNSQIKTLNFILNK